MESCVKSIRQMRTIRRYRDMLSQIVSESSQLYRLTAMDELLNSVMGQVNRIFGIEDAFIHVQRHFFKNSAAESVGAGEMPSDYYAGTGVYAAEAGRLPENLTEMQQRDGNEVPDGQEGENRLCRIFSLTDENQESFGVFGAAIPPQHYFDTVCLLEIYLRQVTSTISNLMLHVQLQMAYEKLETGYEEMTETVRTMVDARDLYTRGHSDRVSYYACRIAEKMGKDEKFINRIRVAGLFHDIGKIAVPDSVLLKSASLTPAEFDIIKRHPGLGYQILSAISSYREIAPIVLCHHERIDGKGYPNGIPGDKIPEEAKMISVADAFDAMTSHRRYRENLTLEQAVEQLKQGKGTQFDRRIVEAFVEILKDYETIRKEISWTYAETALNLKDR